MRNCGRGDVARHHVQPGIGLLDAAQRARDVGRMAVRRVEHHGIHVLIDQRLHAVHHVGRDAHARGHAQAALGVLAGVRMVLHLGYVLVGDESHQAAVVVHDGEFLDLVVEQHLGGVLKLRAVGGDQPVARHHVVDAALHVALEPQVAVGDDADQPAPGVHHRNAADLVLLHQGEGVAHGVVLGDGDRIVDHAVLGALHAAHLRGLLGDRHVFVDDADAPLARQRDGQRGLRHGVHRRRDDGNIELDITRETGLQGDLPRQHFRKGGHEQHIVERKSFGLYPFIDK